MLSAVVFLSARKPPAILLLREQTCKKMLRCIIASDITFEGGERDLQ